MKTTRFSRHTLSTLGILALCVPVTFVVTIMLMPVWSAVERRWGIESVGHSGPSGWCFWVVYACALSISFGVYLARHARRDAPGSVDLPDR